MRIGASRPQNIHTVAVESRKRVYTRYMLMLATPSAALSYKATPTHGYKTEALGTKFPRLEEELPRSPPLHRFPQRFVAEQRRCHAHVQAVDTDLVDVSAVSNPHLVVSQVQ